MNLESPNLNVLAVDDEPGIRALYARALTGRLRPAAAGAAAPVAPLPKFQLHLASSGAEAVALVERLLQQDIHLAAGFFDVRMPGGMDGIETLRRIRALDPMVLCTVVTAYDEDRLDEINQIFAPDHLDEWDYVNKPFNVAEIMQKARNAVSSWNRRRAQEHQYEQIAELNRTLDLKVQERTAELAESNLSLAAANRELQVVLERLQQTQTHLIQNAKMASIGQLAAGIAHEINNPIGFVQSNLVTLQRYTDRLLDYLTQLEDWARTECQAGVQLAEWRRARKIDFVINDLPKVLDQSTEGTNRVRQIVSDLKTFSHIDQEPVGYTDLNETLRCAINLVSGEVHEGLRVTTELGQIPPVLGQSMELSQAFMNLLLNAVQATKAPGEIKLSTRFVADGVEVVISDTGCGIPPEHLERAFEPFFTTKEVGGGVGLGLTVAYNTIKHHLGDLRLHSEVGVGTTVTAFLPVKAAEATMPAGESRAEPDQLRLN